MASTALSSTVIHERMLSRLRLKHLRLLVSLSVHTTLRLAAEEVHISQPAATQMLREIESLLDARLFERHARGMRPTPAGGLLIGHAWSVMESMRVAADGLAANAAAGERPVRIGVIAAAVPGIVSLALPALRQQGLRVEIVDESIERQMELLANGALDIALLRKPAGVPLGHRFVPLLKDQAVVVAGRRHPAAGLPRVSLKQLADSRWILPPRGFAVRTLIDDAFRRARMVPREHEIQTVVNTLVVALLEAGDVVLPAPRSAVLDGIRAQHFVELKLPLRAPMPPVGALIRPDAIGLTANRVLECLASAARDA
ncbi:LysR family transcriptional regulator [Piscinibacter terrae]|nr:LysR family transcriptional regulator [Albitalea terrae]